MQATLLTIAIAVILAVIAALVGPFFIDWGTYRSVFEQAFPVLRRLGVPGTVFAPTDFIGRPEPMSWPGIDRWLSGPHEHELACMDADQLRELADAGWEIGSHTRSHPRLTSLSDGLGPELAGSRARIEELVGAPCQSLAYPYGDADDRVAAAAAEAGYLAAATLVPFEPRPEPLLWPRPTGSRSRPHPWPGAPAWAASGTRSRGASAAERRLGGRGRANEGRRLCRRP